MQQKSWPPTSAQGSARLIRVVSGRIGAGEGACGTAAVHGRSTCGGQVDDGAVAVTGGDDVVGGVAKRAVSDDETPGAADLDAAIVEGDVVSFDAVAQASSMNAGAVSG